MLVEAKDIILGIVILVLGYLGRHFTKEIFS